jgi:hypothetical protein
MIKYSGVIFEAGKWTQLIISQSSKLAAKGNHAASLFSGKF